jgi:hypothetical protein
MFNPLIGFSNRADVLQAHLFNQSILERFIYPFHATFCLAAVGTNQLIASSRRARPNWVVPVRRLSGPLTLNTACLSL